MPIELGSFDVIISIGDETLTIRSSRSDGYASIVDSEQRAKLFGRIGTLEQDNIRLRGMLGVERQRVDCLWRSMSYHLVKANVATDALSRKERAKPPRVGALVMTINSNLPPQIHEAQVEALKKENVKDENLHGTDKDFEIRLDKTLGIRRRNWLSHCRDLRKLIMHGSHKNLTFSSTLDRIRYIIILSSCIDGPTWKQASLPVSTSD
ncbi:hypothetical protein Tco_0754149 [Tanacetum coccineum]